jgi:hypothetical protein
VQYEVLQCADRGGEQCADSAGEAEREDDFLRGLRNEEMGASSVAEEGEDSSVQPQVQWRSPRRGVEATRTQGAEALETGVGVCVEDSDDWPNQSSVEGRIDLPEAQRGVCRPVDQVRPLSASIFVHGAEGWLCDGAPSTGRSSYGQATPESGSGASQEPQGYGKPTDKPDAICDERGTQGIRAWRGHKTAVVRVVPFQYTGKMWCLRVPTGAFVAFRGGVAFPTGNSGFPKSLDVSKAIDKAGGRAENWFGPWLRDERERIGLSATRLAELGNFYKNVNHGGLVVNWELGYGLPSVKEFNKVCEILSLPFERLEEVERQVIGQRKVHKGVAFTSDGKEYLDVTLPATDAAKQWTGWGTALKPAHEPICVARKPIEGTVAANVLKWGTGALNIDGCRVEYLSEADKASATPQGECTAKVGALAGGTQNETERSAFERPEQKGRWPANVIHDGSEEVLAAFPNAPGQCADVKYDAEERKTQNVYGAMKRGHEPSAERTYEEEGSTNFSMKPGARRLDQGSAARFFKACEFSEYELLLCRAKAIMESWNPDFASTVNNSLSLSESHVVSALSDAVTLVSHGGIRLKDLTVLSMNVTPAELRMLCESVIVTILSSEIKSWPASFRFDTGRLNGSLVNGAEALERIGTTTTTASRMSSGGCAAVATFDSTWSNTAVGEVGSPSRVFYCAKTSKAERGEGNSHPTVKPIALMRYLCKLVTPPGGVVLDPFMGSGSTGLAAIREGFEFIGIELNPDYIKMANSRLLAEILK